MARIIIKWSGIEGVNDGRQDVAIPPDAEIEDVLLSLEDALRAMGFAVPPFSLGVLSAADCEE